MDFYVVCFEILIKLVEFFIIESVVKLLPAKRYITPVIMTAET